MNWKQFLFQDWQVNPDNPRIRLILVMFRLAQKLSQLKGVFYLLAFPYLAFYRLLVEWFLCLELHWKTQVGPRLSIFHGYALVVSRDTIIGSDCVLRQSTTIGMKTDYQGIESGSPKIGNHVDIGANAVIIGPVLIGDYSIIGAGSVVVKDIPPGTIVAGNPARVIKQNPLYQNGA